MKTTHRKHVLVPDQTIRILEDYQRRHGLTSFSGAVEAAAQALEQQELRAAYTDYTHEYAQNPQAQAEAEKWLGLPMEEVEPDRL
ncbi:hypothetical protein [Deinococcus sp.]|uniref:hypothetical protein n=1 Tax=Deinococcus sp. TaxID=47478 RepID=UPI0025F05D8C|nr:hypothetical protein [Deinococcus sp.]